MHDLELNIHASKHRNRGWSTRISDSSHREVNCDGAVELMSPFIDSMVSPEEADGLRSHVSQCEPCQRQLQSFISVRNLVTRMEPVRPPADMVLETRVKLSHARSRNWYAWFETQLNNVLKPLAIPALLGT